MLEYFLMPPITSTITCLYFSFHSSPLNKLNFPFKESVRSTSGGWQIPRYDSETEFSEFGGKPSKYLF